MGMSLCRESPPLRPPAALKGRVHAARASSGGRAAAPLAGARAVCLRAYAAR
jgi:hypothetical protein